MTDFIPAEMRELVEEARKRWPGDSAELRWSSRDLRDAFAMGLAARGKATQRPLEGDVREKLSEVPERAVVLAIKAYEEVSDLHPSYEAMEAAILAAFPTIRETEWEYAVSHAGYDDVDEVFDSREDLADYYGTGIAWDTTERLVRRRKAGPWEPVQEVEK